MRNPLYKRLPRELKHDFGKYFVIFSFMVLLIGVVSGFLVTDNSVRKTYDEGFIKYNLEDGHFSTFAEIDEETLKDIEDDQDIELYEMFYNEQTYKDDSLIRIYITRDEVNLPALFEGELPSTNNEIALDRMFAENNEIAVGDSIRVGGRTLTVSGLVAVPDYSCLFENNSAMMFDAKTFSIALMNEAGFTALGKSKLTYNYAWTYKYEVSGDEEEKEVSDELMKYLLKHTTLTSILPRYLNQAINFTGDDMGSDKAMITLFHYIILMVMAFIFAFTSASTIDEEAQTIGTLRASGYKKEELVRHYLILPIFVSFIGGIVGNIFGYTLMEDVFVGIYFNSYSLAPYESYFSMEAFITTTVIPMIMMLVINFVVLSYKMQLHPLQFLRGELTRHKRKRAFHLSSKIKFMTRFRLRVIFQNMPNYIVLFCGILLSGAIVVFGLMLPPLINTYGDMVSESMIAKYQYVLKQSVETDEEQAEKYAMTSLKTIPDEYKEDSISIYGIEKDSAYVDLELKEHKIYVSDSILDKFNLEVGDYITLKGAYNSNTYKFEIAGSYAYDAGLAVFMDINHFNVLFGNAKGYYTGYFSDVELDDIDDAYIASIITEDDFLKVAKQLELSMGTMMSTVSYFGVIMFILMMYLLSKQIIEKNANAIAMSKILGFKDREIAGLYIIATSIVVVASLLLSIPLLDKFLYWGFHVYLYKEMSGYIPYMIHYDIYLKMVSLGICSYALVAFFQYLKIVKIDKSLALKNMD